MLPRWGASGLQISSHALVLAWMRQGMACPGRQPSCHPTAFEATQQQVNGLDAACQLMLLATSLCLELSCSWRGRLHGHKRWTVPCRFEGTTRAETPHGKGVMIMGSGLGGGIQAAEKGDKYACTRQPPTWTVLWTCILGSAVMLAPSKQLLLFCGQSLAVLSCRLMNSHSHWFLAGPGSSLALQRCASQALLLVMCCCCHLSCQVATALANAAGTP